MWHKPCRTFHPWCLCIKTRCLLSQCWSNNLNSLRPGDTFMSVNWFIISSGYGLASVWCQDITWTNSDLSVGIDFRGIKSRYSKIYTFIQDIPFKYFVCKMVAIILQPPFVEQYLKWYLWICQQQGSFWARAQPMRGNITVSLIEWSLNNKM